MGVGGCGDDDDGVSTQVYVALRIFVLPLSDKTFEKRLTCMLGGVYVR